MEDLIILGDSTTSVYAVGVARVIVLVLVVLIRAGFNLELNEFSFMLHRYIIGSAIWNLVGWVAIKVQVEDCKQLSYISFILR